jgi:hypothetical protein
MLKQFNNKILFAYLCLTLIILIVISVYASKINVYEDLRIEIQNANNQYANSGLLLVTPFNREFEINQNDKGIWEVKNTYSSKIKVRIETDSLTTDKLNILVNKHLVIINSQNIYDVNSGSFVDIELPYTSGNNLITKLSYVFLSNFKNWGNNTYRKILLFTFPIIMVLLMLIFALNSKTKILIYRRVNYVFSDENKDSKVNKSIFQGIIFGLFWLILIILTITII